MEFPFEGIPTVPPRKNMTHMVSGPPPSTKCRPLSVHTHELNLTLASVRCFSALDADTGSPRLQRTQSARCVHHVAMADLI